LLTPWNRVVLEKLIGFQLVKKFPAFYGTRKFITAFTSAPPPVPIVSQLDLVHAPYILLPDYPSSYYPHIYAWVFQMVSFSQVSPPKPCTRLSPPPYAQRAPPSSFFSIFLPKQYWVSSTDN